MFTERPKTSEETSHRRQLPVVQIKEGHLGSQKRTICWADGTQKSKKKLLKKIKNIVFFQLSCPKTPQVPKGGSELLRTAIVGQQQAKEDEEEQAEQEAEEWPARKEP